MVFALAYTVSGVIFGFIVRKYDKRHVVFFIFFRAHNNDIAVKFLRILSLLIALSSRVLLFTSLHFRHVRPIVSDPGLFLNRCCLTVQILRPLRVRGNISFNMVFFRFKGGEESKLFFFK